MLGLAASSAFAMVHSLRAAREARERGVMSHGHWKANPPSHGCSAGQSGSGDGGARSAPSALHKSIAARKRAERDKAIPHAGVRAGEIIAWRCWLITPGGLLRSTNFDTIWSPEEIQVASDLDKSLSGIGFGKGIYGIKNDHNIDGRRTVLVQARLYAGTLCLSTIFLPSHMQMIATGQIAMWGEVIEHEYGYRAEYAKIVSLNCVTCADSNVPLLNRLTRRLRNRWINNKCNKLLTDLQYRYRVPALVPEILHDKGCEGDVGQC